jgi:ATP-binding cassette, subfamily B, multidrug efflux pump
MDRTLLRAFAYLKPHRNIAVGGFVSLALMTVATLASPLVLRYIIDRGITGRSARAIAIGAVLLVLVAVFRGFFQFLQGYLSERAAQNVAFDMRNDIFGKLQSLSFSYYDRSQTGQLMTRLTSDVDMVRQIFGQGILQAITGILTLIGTAIILLLLDWRLALVALATVPVIVVVLGRFMGGLRPRFMAVQAKLSALNTVLQENIAGIRVVQSFAREPYEVARYEVVNEDLRDENVSVFKAISIAFPLLFFVSNLGSAAVVWVGGVEVIGRSLSIGTLVAFNTYLVFLTMPLLMLGFIATGISRATASTHRIYEVLDAEAEVREKPDAIDLPPIKGRVEFDHVQFRYVGSESDVLCDVSLLAEPGQTIALVGTTGSGKSSVISLIPRFYDVREGRVTIDGHDVRDVTLDSLRRQVGIVLQETTLFSGSISDNIAFGLPNASLADIQAAARAAQVDEFIEGLPMKYDTLIGERGIGLSGGQQQRIAIARTLLLDPKVLILDDSTSSVDAETEHKILEQLDHLMEGRTSFVIAQRISTVMRADVIVVLDGGRIVAKGTHDEVLASSALYGEIVDSQLRHDVPAGPGDAKFDARTERTGRVVEPEGGL